VQEPICSIEWCDRRANGRGSMCNAHDKRNRRGSDMTKPIEPRRPKGQCSVDGCDRLRRSGGYCNGHYAQQRRTGRTTSLARSLKIETCTITGCATGAMSTGLCPSHRRQTRYGLSAMQLDMFILSHTSCEICGTQFGDRVKLNIDHDHSCCPGQDACGECIRGALCAPCNQAIGLLRDDTSLMFAAIRYISA